MVAISCAGCGVRIEVQKHTTGLQVWCKGCGKNGFTWDPLTGKTTPSKHTGEETSKKQEG